MRKISDYTKTELDRLAQDLQIEGRSKMRKAELYAAIRTALAEQHEREREREAFYRALHPRLGLVLRELSTAERMRVKALIKTGEIPLCLHDISPRVPFFHPIYDSPRHHRSTDVDQNPRFEP